MRAERKLAAVIIAIDLKDTLGTSLKAPKQQLDLLKATSSRLWVVAEKFTITDIWAIRVKVIWRVMDKMKLYLSIYYNWFYTYSQTVH